ncbi:MAG: NAD(P)/FAD-dependent oxidoreductase [Chloroflexi bacterium CFX7]|nr:NAD(P)/FAD-dependent oxidoreductase [Chloroflexi bacterium CFX7]
MHTVDVAIAGGGIAGLVAANFAARAGKSVALFERASNPGGRAQTTLAGGARLNLGPHALFSGGANAAILDELGICPAETVPPEGPGNGLRWLRGGRPGGYQALKGGRLHILPVSATTLARTGLLGLRAKVEFGRLFAAVAKADAGAVDGVSLRDWVDGLTTNAAAREAFFAVVRLSTYAGAPDLLSAGAAIRQLRLPGGVRYLDGGWRELVEALRARAIEAGAVVEESAPVKDVAIEGGVATGLRLRDGRMVRAGAVVLATPPDEAAAISGLASVSESAHRLTPMKSAVLDMVLRGLPRPRRTFALGIDTLTYLSVHSHWADLAPGSESVIHLAKYLNPGERGSAATEAELEAVLDTVQPGWRDRVVFRRFLPNLTVAGALPTAATGGTAGRPPERVPGMSNLFLAGDWVGSEGMLADAAFASGRRAGELAASVKMRALATA